MTNDFRSTIEFRSYLPAVWLALLALTAVVLPGRIWNTLLIGLGGLFIVAYWWARQMARGLSANRRLRFGWVAVGDRLSEQFEIRNDSYLPALWVEVVDESNVPGYHTAVVRTVEPHGRSQWRQSAICERRGHFRLGPWAIRSGDPFGIFRVTAHYASTEEIIIHPPVDTKIPIALPAGQSSGQARARERSLQATVNAATIRAYQPHDPYRWIHWPISAHRDSLYVRQFDQDVGGDVWLLLDLQTAVQLGHGAASTEEYMVLLAAALAARALQQNRAVGLAAYGREPQLILTGRGQGQQWKLLRALALIQADGETNLELALRDLRRVGRRGATAVIITANGRADWLSALLPLVQRGIQSTVILLDRPSFGGEGNSEGARQAIRSLGFACDILRQGDLSPSTTNRERRGFWEFKVTGSGKVVTVHSPGDG